VILSPLGLLLQKRPASGLWGGLWSFPESPIEVAGDGSDGVRHDGGADEATRLAKPEYGLAAVLEQVGLGSPASGLPRNVEPLPAFTHQFTHFRLAIQPMLVRLPPATLPPAGVSEPTPCMWYREDAHQVGLSAVVTRVLDVVRPLLAGLPTTNENDGDRR
jgi:A/G-specific adenine glycosylase